jgi:hypothetical protein
VRARADQSFVTITWRDWLLALVLVGGCAGLDFTPSGADVWSDESFSLERVTMINVAPVVDVRRIERGDAVSLSVAVRSAALSLLREKGYEASTYGSTLSDASALADPDLVLELTGISASAGGAEGVVLAIAIETTEPDVVAPRSARVRLRGALVDVANERAVWTATAVAESGFASGVGEIAPTATAYGAVYQALRALLADLPSRPVAAIGEVPRASGTRSPRRAIE